MKTQKLGMTDLVTTRLSHGGMRLSGIRNGADVCLAAYEAGYRLFDTADVYGDGKCESILGEALKQTPGFRDDILIATKCGIRRNGDPTPDAPWRYDFSADHILRSCEGSLERLGIETIDIYQLHRPDVLADPHEIAGTFEKLKQQGKVRYFGVSNFLPSQVLMLQQWLNMPIVVNQVQIHLLQLDCFQDGTLDQCIERQITPLAYCPVAGGLLGEGATIEADDPRKATIKELHDKLDTLAGEFGASRAVIAIAWLLKHPAGIIPIVGSANADHVRDAAKADDIELSREQWYDLYQLANGSRLP